MMQPDPLGKLGILAGGGVLPRLLIDASAALNRDVFVIAFKDQCDPETLIGVNHKWVRLGAAGTSIKALHKEHVETLVMAGRIHKPSLLQLMPDAKALSFLAGGMWNKGDDGLLRGIIKFLEKNANFKFVGAHDVRPDLLATSGVMGAVKPDERMLPSLKLAMDAALDLGRKDQGQAAVAVDDKVLALEDRLGTDAMLKALGNRAQGGVLAKMCKPGQERRVDLPTIGVATIQHAAAAKLSGIAVQSGAALIIDRAEVIKAADDAGMFVCGVEPS